MFFFHNIFFGHKMPKVYISVGHFGTGYLTDSFCSHFGAKILSAKITIINLFSGNKVFWVIFCDLYNEMLLYFFFCSFVNCRSLYFGSHFGAKIFLLKTTIILREKHLFIQLFFFIAGVLVL
jgi:hypothetical protein